MRVQPFRGIFDMAASALFHILKVAKVDDTVCWRLLHDFWLECFSWLLWELHVLVFVRESICCLRILKSVEVIWVSPWHGSWRAEVALFGYLQTKRLGRVSDGVEWFEEYWR